MTKTTVALWQFPHSDFDQWKELTGERLKHYGDYRAFLVALQTDLERQKYVNVVRVQASVAEVLEVLQTHGLPNDHAGRATAIRHLAAVAQDDIP